MQIPKIKTIPEDIRKEEFSKYLRLMPSLKEEKTQKFTTIALTLGASILLGIFALNPTLSTIVRLQKQIEDDKFVEQKLQQKINNLSVLQQKYESVKLDLPLVYDALPTSSKIPLLLGQIQAVANETNITFDNFQTFQVDVSKGAVSGKKYSSYDFTMSAKGTYQDINSFLDKVINFQRVISVINISVFKTENANDNSLQVGLKGTAFFKE